MRNETNEVGNAGKRNSESARHCDGYRSGQIRPFNDSVPLGVLANDVQDVIERRAAKLMPGTWFTPAEILGPDRWEPLNQSLREKVADIMVTLANHGIVSLEVSTCDDCGGPIFRVRPIAPNARSDGSWPDMPDPGQAEMTDSSAEVLPFYIERVEDLLDGMDPNHLGLENWSRAVNAIFYRTGGSEAGFALALRWSGRLNDYPGDEYVSSFWLLAALIAMKDLGGDKFRSLRAEYAEKDALHRFSIAEGAAGQDQDASAHLLARAGADVNSIVESINVRSDQADAKNSPQSQ